MNLSPTWTTYLEQAGHDAVHWSSIGKFDATDAEIVHWAFKNDRIILTSDLDFGAILAASGDNRPSVVLLRSDLLGPLQLGGLVLSAVDASSADLQSGALLTIDAVQARLRILPLGKSDN
jgi:predicted nuclease of predicted toxin-antitoxin system